MESECNRRCISFTMLNKGMGLNMAISMEGLCETFVSREASEQENEIEDLRDEITNFRKRIGFVIFRAILTSFKICVAFR